MKYKNKSPRHRIHRHLKKGSPRGVHKAKKLFGFKYPKLFLLILSILFAYYLFRRPIVSSWILNLSSLSYVGIFIAGIFISFGFSAPFSFGFFLSAKPENIFFAVLIGSFGAVISDLIIFKSIKFSFMDEFKELEKSRAIKKIENIIKKNRHIRVKHYLLYVFAGIMLATPLPDEIGVSMFAGLTHIKPLKLALISFIMHLLTIFLILYFGVRI